MQQHESGPSKRTLILAAWAFCTAFWAVFTPPDKTWPARVLLFQLTWFVRIYIQDHTWTQDLGLALALQAVYGYYTGAWRPPSPSDFAAIDVHSEGFRIYVGVFGLLALCGTLAGGIVRRESQLKSEVRNAHLFDRRIDEQLLPPLLISSRTSHSRMIPQKHSFAYSYLFVGVPVGLSGRLSAALSVDCDTHSWFHVDSSDYLTRGAGEHDLGGKLKQFLHSQGVTDRDYAFAYLVTAPKFLGYSFNPASFWYIYDSEAALKYMIVEVNNTFDERRLYLLKTDNTSEGGKSATVAENAAPQKTMYFTDSWQKDFHVSPFNSTKGSYSLKAIDPLAAFQETGSIKIDNTIVLRSSKEETKIVARVWSQGQPQDATSISVLALLRFLLSWAWVGFLTFPRILWEANSLFFRRKLHVWFRPEVMDTSLGRSYTADEAEIEHCFAAFLEDVASHAAKPLQVTYIAAHSGGHESVVYSPGFTYQEARQRTLTIKVLSPAFYSRLVHYAHIKEAFDRECLATDEKNRTLSLQDPHLLPDFLEAVAARQATWTSRSRSTMGMIRWALLRRLRCPPPAQSYGQEVASADYTKSDIRKFQDSELDRFMRHSDEHLALYQQVAIKLFLAQRIAFGVPALVAMADWAFRASMLLAAMYYSRHVASNDLFRLPEGGSREWSPLLLLLSNGVHIWSFLKG